MKKEEELGAEGWTRRGILSEPRLSEVKNLYEEMGFEVLLKDLNEIDFEEGCAACFSEDPGRFRILYTRLLRNESPDEGGRPGR